MFDEFLTLCDEQYESGLVEFKNGDMVNMPGENDGSAKVLSYGALAEFDQSTTLKVRRFPSFRCVAYFSLLISPIKKCRCDPLYDTRKT